MPIPIGLNCKTGKQQRKPQAAYLPMRKPETTKPDPIAMLRRLHEKGGGLDRAKANAYLAEVRDDRKHWRGK